MANTDLTRFIEAQREDYQRALAEIRNGRKTSHWMWYIFPQLVGLGFSQISRYYAIQDLEEAEAFLKDPFLGGNLLEISHALLALDTDNATEVFGQPDDMKLRSSMTLFSLVKDSDPVFRDALDKFFDGKHDSRTLELLGLKA